MDRVLKFVHGGEVRRIRVDAGGASLTLEDVWRWAREAYPELPQGNYRLQYRGDGGAPRALTADSFPGFLAASGQGAAAATRVELVPPAGAAQRPSQSADADAAGSPRERSPRQQRRPSQSADADASGRPCDHSAHAAGQAPCGPELFRNLFQNLLGTSSQSSQQGERCEGQPLLHLLRGLLGSGAATGSIAAPLLAFVGPHLAQASRGLGESVGRLAAEKPDKAAALLAALREGIDPFPQLEQIQVLLDDMLQHQCLDAVGVAAESFLQTLVSLPLEEQQDICVVVFDVMAQSFSEGSQR